jgi:membrane associated rhomboid family serine protease
MTLRPIEPCLAGLHARRMQQPVEVFRASGRLACEERAFVLTAVGIDSEIDLAADGYVLQVEQPLHAHARHHLWQYEQERMATLPRPAFVPQPGSWWGSLVYAVLLLIPPFALAQGWFPADPYESGALHPALVQEGEWWRAVTALTLHWDAAHLLGNLGGGILLGHSAAQVWGSARAWLLILLAAVGANFIEAFIGFAGYVSAGASTAVFAALGLVAAFAWRARGQSFGTPLARWAPLAAGVALLGFFGGGASVPVAGMPLPESLPFGNDSSTNVLSHLLGFVGGVLAGAVAASERGKRLLAALPDRLVIALSLGPILLAWVLAQWPAS